MYPYLIAIVFLKSGLVTASRNIVTFNPICAALLCGQAHLGIADAHFQ